MMSLSPKYNNSVIFILIELHIGHILSVVVPTGPVVVGGAVVETVVPDDPVVAVVPVVADVGPVGVVVAVVETENKNKLW